MKPIISKNNSIRNSYYLFFGVFSQLITFGFAVSVFSSIKKSENNELDSLNSNSFKTPLDQLTLDSLDIGSKELKTEKKKEYSSMGGDPLPPVEFNLKELMKKQGIEIDKKDDNKPPKQINKKVPIKEKKKSTENKVPTSSNLKSKSKEKTNKEISKLKSKSPGSTGSISNKTKNKSKSTVKENDPLANLSNEELEKMITQMDKKKTKSLTENLLKDESLGTDDPLSLLGLDKSKVENKASNNKINNMFLKNQQALKKFNLKEKDAFNIIKFFGSPDIFKLIPTSAKNIINVNFYFLDFNIQSFIY